MALLATIIERLELLEACEAQIASRRKWAAIRASAREMMQGGDESRQVTAWPSAGPDEEGRSVEQDANAVLACVRARLADHRWRMEMKVRWQSCGWRSS